MRNLINQTPIKAGVKFKMGREPKGHKEKRDGIPNMLHEVKLTRDFFIMKTEMTQELWMEITDSPNPSEYQGSLQLPVENISWVDAVRAANTLNEKLGLETCYSVPENLEGDSVTWNKGYDCKGWRLPTEAEWEYAARGQKGNSEFKYSGSNHANEVAWYFANTNNGAKTRIVGDKKAKNNKNPNGNGLWDMSGNVSEWVWDSYKEFSSQYAEDPNINIPLSKDGRVYRGGSYIDNVVYCEVSHRSYGAPTKKYPQVGVRFVRTK